MDNSFTILIKKAGLITCLFLFTSVNDLAAQASMDWLSNSTYKKAYENCLSLNLTQSRELVKTLNTPEAFYILSLGEALELLITEDKSKFDAFERAYEKRIDELKKINPTTGTSLFVIAELRLHWAFVYLKFGHDFSSAWNVRQAHIATQACQKQFPAFIPIQKTSGILEVMLGSVPEKYQWILGLLGMNGSVELGLSQLAQVEHSENSLSFEANLLTLLIDGFVLQQTDSAVAGIENLHFQNPDNRLLLFLGASLAIKNSMSEMAMNMLEKLKSSYGGLSIYYTDYLLGEVYLHQGNYAKSIQHFQSFIQRYTGENYVKDAHYKIGICYWLNNQSELGATYFAQAKLAGRESVEADKYAARALSQNTLPHVKLSKLRYSTDGGYYDEATRILNSIRQEDLASTKEITEYYYRQARLYHKTNKLEEAKKNYLKTIDLNGQQDWYYAPNSCLQLGYIYAEENKTKDSRNYFLKALSYKKHEYKNSIDSKAKSALDQATKGQ